MASSHSMAVAALLCLLPALSAVQAAQAFDRGQALYENHCRSCHEDEAHTRAARRAASMADLRKWVATWSFHAALDWSGEEIDDVVQYMNRRYYHFTATP